MLLGFSGFYGEKMFFEKGSFASVDGDLLVLAKNGTTIWEHLYGKPFKNRII